MLVEKPLLADNPETSRQLQALAEKAGVTCWTAYNHRFEPNLVRLREVIRSGVLGKIYHARFFYGNGTAADVKKSPWRDQGLGVIPDLGSHLFDLTDYLLDVRPQCIEPWACDASRIKLTITSCWGRRCSPPCNMRCRCCRGEQLSCGNHRGKGSSGSLPVQVGAEQSGGAPANLSERQADRGSGDCRKARSDLAGGVRRVFGHVQRAVQ